ncbi:MAG: FAD-binding protein [Acidimicrobiales bacterium]|nr:FAD-binding protein [Acidimicrobiales bacterium]
MALSAATSPAAARLGEFADDIGATDPVTCVGGRTQWGVGGPVDAGAREVRAPSGVVEHVPEEMTVRVLAGTTVEELHARLLESGQRTVLPERGGATVGGLLSVGRSDLHRLGRGPLRDVLLQAVYVSAEGRVVTVGGPTVKNVTGFDLCRLLVGSLGTIGLLGEVILRTRPVPRSSVWLSGEAPVKRLRNALYRPSALLWDGTRTWVYLEGHRSDVEDQRRVAAAHGIAEEVEGPPSLPGNRWSVPPGKIWSLDPAATGPFVAEVGVGVVHASRPQPSRRPDPVIADLHDRLRERFDPQGRLNPGRDPLGGGA